MKEIINFYEICNLVTGMSNFQREKKIYFHCSVINREQVLRRTKELSVYLVT